MARPNARRSAASCTLAASSIAARARSRSSLERQSGRTSIDFTIATAWSQSTEPTASASPTAACGPVAAVAMVAVFFAVPGSTVSVCRIQFAVEGTPPDPAKNPETR